MNEEAMSKALDAIHDEALKLMKHELSPEVERGIELILSIARYKTDVRSSADMEPQKDTHT
jgi:hypothetical protein